MTLIEIITKISSGIGATFIIFFTTLLFAIPLGLPICFAKMSKHKIFSIPATILISILRGTPLMLQLIVWFFAPYYVFGIRLNPNWRLLSVIIGFSINYAAYFAEIYRSGIQSIPLGQKEAAYILGYTRKQTFRKIVLPQMVKRVIPPMTNEIITLIKDTSLAFVVAYAETFTIAKQVAAAESNIIPLFVAGIFYYVFNYVVAYFMEFVERKFNYYN